MKTVATLLGLGLLIAVGGLTYARVGADPTAPVDEARQQQCDETGTCR